MRFFNYLLIVSSFVYCQDKASAPSDDTLNKSLDTLCSGKNPVNAACSLRQYCAKNTTLAKDSRCKPGVLLASLCSEDKKDDSNCKDFTSKCGTTQLASTNKDYCESLTPIKDLLSAKSMATSLKTVCTHHEMDSCTKAFCPLSERAGDDGNYPCDQLSQLRLICIDMATMDECTNWSKMCKSNDNFAPLCTDIKLANEQGSSSDKKGPSSNSFWNVPSTLLGLSSLGLSFLL